MFPHIRRLRKSKPVAARSAPAPASEPTRVPDSAGEKKFRIFLSYRGESSGDTSSKAFSEDLYRYLTEDPLYRQRYGEIYYSPKTGGVYGNFELDIDRVMANVEYFVMPLNAAYFADFWDEERNRPKESSITYKEIRAAMQVNCRFICVALPGFEVDLELNRKLFGDNASIINCAIMLECQPGHETALFRRIEDAIVRSDYNVSGMADIIKHDTPNVYLSFKNELERADKYPFYQKLYDVKRMTLVNFASSVFLSGIDIASIYEEGDYLKRWFSYHLATGKIEVDVVLTDPHCWAAHDAALYKMFPVGQKLSTSDIILHNINKLCEFMRKNPEARINLYLTKIALPYGIMATENNNPANSHMKVDLYAPVTNDDGYRPSFYLLQSDPQTAALYSFFMNNARNIIRNYSYAYTGHPDTSWLVDEPIIHRGVASPELLPHTERAFAACLDYGNPIEVDLLELKDQTIVVGRADQDIRRYGFDKSLADCTAADLRKINAEAGEDRILTLSEFFTYINGRIPVVLEVKTRETGECDPATQRYITRIMSEVESYLEHCIAIPVESSDTKGIHVAVHSSNPYALQLIRSIDSTIPCGLISSDYGQLLEGRFPELAELHEEERIFDVFQPDFLNYDIRYMSNGIARRACERAQIPLLAWVVRNAEDEEDARTYQCDNIVIEGARSFL